MRSLFGTAIACVFAVSFLAAAAQEKPMAAKEHTMSGCLQKGSGDMYTVTNTAEKGPKTIGIVSSSADLKGHVGHKIDITGTAVPNAEAEAMKPAPPKADHYMKISAVKMVSATCP
jgi:hypothetical protein